MLNGQLTPPCKSSEFDAMKDLDNGPVRVAIVVSHPIQHFVPFYRALAQETQIRIKVLFGSKIGVEKYTDKDMGVEIAWDMDLLGGYEHEFLPGADLVKNTGFWSLNNPHVAERLDECLPDVVMVYGYAQLTNIRVVRWCRRNNVPVLMQSDSELLGKRTWYIRAIKQLLLRPLFKRISGFLTIGDKNEAYCANYGVSRQKVFRAPLTIDEDEFGKVRKCRLEHRKRYRARLQIPEDAFVALFVGKLIQRKRPVDIVVALRNAASKATNQPLWALFAGDGELRKKLEEKTCADAINHLLLGFVNVRELPEVYAAADVLIHPSHKDAHPLSTCEACYMGLPLIVSDKVGSVGPTDTARPDVNALVYPCGDTVALAEAFLTLVKDSERCKNMGDASLRIAQELGMTESVNGFLRAVRAVTSERQQTRRHDLAST